MNVGFIEWWNECFRLYDARKQSETLDSAVAEGFLEYLEGDVDAGTQATTEDS